MTGKCSVPMWMAGMPADTCGETAYGRQYPGKVHRRWDGFEWRDDGRWPGYAPGLACPAHGGPTLKDLAHKGDPCEYCGVDHDDVPPGPCQALVDKHSKEK